VTVLAGDALVNHHPGVTQGQFVHMSHHANLSQGGALPNVPRGTGGTNHTHHHRQVGVPQDEHHHTCGSNAESNRLHMHVMCMQYKLIANLDKRNSISNTEKRSRFEATQQYNNGKKTHSNETVCDVHMQQCFLHTFCTGHDLHKFDVL